MSRPASRPVTRLFALTLALCAAPLAGCGDKKDAATETPAVPADPASPAAPLAPPVPAEPALPADVASHPEVTEAWKAADAIRTKIKKSGNDEAARTAAKQELEAFAKSKVELFSAQRATFSKMDLCYLGLLQGMAGDTQAGIATLRESNDKKVETKYGVNIVANLVQALLDAGEPDGAAIEATKMAERYAEARETKTVIMNVGMAYRGAMKWEKSAEWLKKSFDLGNPSAIKPLVNSLLMAGKQDEAVAAAKNAAETGPPQVKDDMLTLAAITEKIGSDVGDMLKFDAFVPAGEPEMKDKVVVLGFWNVTSKTFKATLKLLDSIKKGYGDEVCCIAATTYYKKNAETGKIEESMSPEQERGFGAALADQESWRGWMGYLKDQDAVHAWGVSALPHFVVVSRDGKLLFAHTMDFGGGGETDVKILRKVLDDATGQ